MSAVLIPTATETEWLAARRNGVTASEIPIILGLSPWSSPYALYHQKLGNLPEQDGSDDDTMALGRYLEAYIAGRFALLDWWYVGGDGRGLYAHPDRPWQMATPDRLLYDWEPDEISETSGFGFTRGPVAVLECKIDGGSDEWGDDGTGQIPVHYRAQVLWQMDVMGVTTGYVACLLWQRRKIRVYNLTLDAQAEADLKLMRDEARNFLDRIDLKDPPEVDWRPATTGALKRLHPSVEDRDVRIPRDLASRYQAACKAVKAAERRRDLAANQIRARIGPARYAVTSYAQHAERVARRDVYDLPEKTITRKATTVDRLVAVTPRKSPCGP